MSQQNQPKTKSIRPKANAAGAVKAREKAQWLAFSPIIFYASVVMRDAGLLAHLSKATSKGLTLEELCAESGWSEYAVSVLLDLAADVEIVVRRGDRFVLDDLGYFLMNDTMTRVNMDFVRDICYNALPFLEQSLTQGKPAGLKTLGDWPNVYEGLSQLSEPARSSWFRFDHYYSDTVFDSLLPVIFSRPVRRLLDIGANTGRWASKCLAYNADVHMVMVDLPGQLAVAEKSIAEQGFTDRVTFHPMDVLVKEDQFPSDCDTIWMSQFLDCFAPEDIQSILQRLVTGMGPETRLYILEPFSDKQQYTAASLSLNATSLYFSCVANGTSRMYRYDQFSRWVIDSGLDIEEEHHLNFGHSLLVCRAR